MFDGCPALPCPGLSCCRLPALLLILLPGSPAPSSDCSTPAEIAAQSGGLRSWDVEKRFLQTEEEYEYSVVSPAAAVLGVLDACVV